MCCFPSASLQLCNRVLRHLNIKHFAQILDLCFLSLPKLCSYPLPHPRKSLRLSLHALHGHMLSPRLDHLRCCLPFRPLVDLFDITRDLCSCNVKSDVHCKLEARGVEDAAIFFLFFFVFFREIVSLLITSTPINMTVHFHPRQATWHIPPRVLLLPTNV